MKTALFALFLLSTTVACAQGVSNTAPITSTFQVVTHPERATPQPMAQEQSLLDGPGAGYTMAQGERPLWEFASAKQEVPLGDVARRLRKEHEAAKKATFIIQD